MTLTSVIFCMPRTLRSEIASIVMSSTVRLTDAGVIVTSEDAPAASDTLPALNVTAPTGKTLNSIRIIPASPFVTFIGTVCTNGSTELGGLNTVMSSVSPAVLLMSSITARRHRDSRGSTVKRTEASPCQRTPRKPHLD